jgi:predicted transcriptional regulator
VTTNYTEAILEAMKHKPTVAEAIMGHCTHSQVTWAVNDDEVGFILRKWRYSQGVTLRRLARKLKMSAPYLSDLEIGNRKWSLKKVEAYIAALPQPEAVLAPTLVFKSDAPPAQTP